jgi:formylmethanofuran dehydrogenase subunit E
MAEGDARQVAGSRRGTTETKGNQAMDYAQIVRFHGHSCPGLAVGYRMAQAAMAELWPGRAADEELVAIVENNACGVDALQCLTGCTFGKGNLVFRDYGKQVYTLYSRAGGDAVRVVFHGRAMPEGLGQERDARAKWILTAPAEEMLSVTHVSIPAPEPAQILRSAPCEECGEMAMETRLMSVGARRLCIPCAEQIGNR